MRGDKDIDVEEPSLPRKRNRAAFAILLLTCLYPVWVRGGTHTRWQLPMLLLGLCTLATLVITAARERGGRGGGRVWRDPVFFTGAAFLLLLGVQWVNAGRPLLLDAVRWNWYYGEAPVAWLPSAIRREDAGEMLCWFAPAWAVLLAVRSPIFGYRDLRRLFRFMAVSASCLAFCGFVQWLLAVCAGVGCKPDDGYFATSFGYANHAGAFFNIVLCISAGRLLERLLTYSGKPRRTRSSRRLALWVICCILCFVGVHLSCSRAAMLIAWSIVSLTLVYWVCYDWSRASWPRRIDRLLWVLCLAAVICLGVWSAAGRSIKREFGELASGRSGHTSSGGQHAAFLQQVRNFGVAGTSGARTYTRGGVVRIWQDHCWFGTGGWGARHLLPLYIDIPEDEEGTRIDEGWANTHCDPLQFLSEFGIIGASLLFLSVAMGLRPYGGYTGFWGRPSSAFAILGLLSTLAYSLVDLPFRCPAILFAWTALLGALPRFVAKNHGTP